MNLMKLHAGVLGPKKTFNRIQYNDSIKITHNLTRNGVTNILKRGDPKFQIPFPLLKIFEKFYCKYFLYLLVGLMLSDISFYFVSFLFLFHFFSFVSFMGRKAPPPQSRPCLNPIFGQGSQAFQEPLFGAFMVGHRHFSMCITVAVFLGIILVHIFSRFFSHFGLIYIVGRVDGGLSSWVFCWTYLR